MRWRVELIEEYVVEADNETEALDRAMAVQRGGRIEGVDLTYRAHRALHEVVT